MYKYLEASFTMNHTLLGTPVPVGQQIKLALRQQRREIYKSLSATEARWQQELQSIMASRPELHEVVWAFVLGMWCALLCTGIVMCILKQHKKHYKKKRII